MKEADLRRALRERITMAEAVVADRSGNLSQPEILCALALKDTAQKFLATLDGKTW